MGRSLSHLFSEKYMNLSTFLYLVSAFMLQSVLLLPTFSNVLSSLPACHLMLKEQVIIQLIYYLCRLPIFNLSMTHTVANSTRLSFSFRPKTKKQPIKKFLSLAVSFFKTCQNLQNSDFQSQFSMPKNDPNFSNFFSSKIIILEAHILLLAFFETSIFKPLFFLK